MCYNITMKAKSVILMATVGAAAICATAIVIRGTRTSAREQSKSSASLVAVTNGVAVVAAARSQIGITTRYDSAYRSMSYPNGDVPRECGVCTDVIIRALRDACAVDLQKLVHEDMKANFAKYPQLWGLKKPDTNIDHRRVPNLQCYFKRKGCSRSVTRKASDYEPGDFVTVIVGGRLPHIMIVSDKKAADGTPLVIHNIGSGTKEENCLFTYPLTGHYRMKKIKAVGCPYGKACGGRLREVRVF